MRGCLPTFQERKHLVSVGFGQREVELLRRRKALKDAVDSRP